MIPSFQGKYRFLSNFWPAPIVIDNVEYPSSEHYYQAQKCLNPNDAEQIRLLPKAGQAKKLVRKFAIRSDWENVKLQIMEKALRAKFEQHPEIMQLLLETGDELLQEGNTWHDVFWGVDITTNTGENHLGKLLMKLREEWKNQLISQKNTQS